ncbi:merozoite surface protein 10, putative [Plasmodium chabaudi adami]|uniref:Merozoite surface protein 10, putative n=1 Tax=Plasmodium chabaudi adami TaxID=5826 RepID=A0A1D3RXZ0_PLACE|nr:merozoite surface protein 10, putative [Plasmodium chabaudi adami]
MILVKRNKLFTLSLLLVVYANNAVLSGVNDKNDNITIIPPSQENNEEDVIEEIDIDDIDDIDVNNYINMDDEDDEINYVKETYFIRKENYNNTTQNNVPAPQNNPIEDLKEQPNSVNSPKMDAFKFVNRENKTNKKFEENVENNKKNINNKDHSFLGKFIRVIPNIEDFGKVNEPNFDQSEDQVGNPPDVNQTVEGKDDADVQEDANINQGKSADTDQGNAETVSQEKGEEDNHKKSETENPNGEIPTEQSKDTNPPNEEPSNSDEVKSEEDTSANDASNAQALKSDETPTTTTENSAEKKSENGKDAMDHAQIMHITMLEENRNLKETTRIIDETVYSFERFILKCKFYITAIINFVKFKTNHICEYSKCGDHARCYIVEKDQQECRCLANYVRDTSVEYFKCIPMTTKDCTNNNGNCDKNAECSIKNNNIICYCSYNYFGDGIFCVPNSNYNNFLHISLIIIGCILQKFLF